MKIKTRRILDKSFTGMAYASLGAMCLALAVFLLPIIFNGAGAFVFRATVEHYKFLRENLDSAVSGYAGMVGRSDAARAPLYKMMAEFENPAGADGLEARLKALRAGVLESLVSRSPEVVSILSETPASGRLGRIRAFGSELWKPYSDGLAEMARESLRDGNAFALQKLLKRGEAEGGADIRAALDKVYAQGGLTLSQKSAFRRNFSEFPRLAAERALAELDASTAAYLAFKKGVSELLGPENAAQKEKTNLMRQKYGQPRMDQAEEVLKSSVLKINVRELDAEGREILLRADTAEYFKGTPVAAMAAYVKDNFAPMMQPRWTFYSGFFFDNPYDSNIFGGIWPMILGTFYLTIGAMIIAAPLGIIAAVYFSEYAKKGFLVSLLRMCVGTLAGVPSIVFGLFGLAFLINTLKVSESKSVLAGSITLALLILPTIIRSCEEALKSVPQSYREASLGLGAGKWKSITGVILPSALPGMLTGIIISMGRAAGETAPIIFTAATSTGAALAVWEVFTQATPALPWNIYNMCSEHEMADKVAHVQYGMVLTLIGIVLTLNLAAIMIRARLQKRLRT